MREIVSKQSEANWQCNLKSLPWAEGCAPLPSKAGITKACVEVSRGCMQHLPSLDWELKSKCQSECVACVLGVFVVVIVGGGGDGGGGVELEARGREEEEEKRRREKRKERKEKRER